MSEVEIAHELVHSYVKEIGLTKDQTFNAERNAWYWFKGSAKIEVFIQTVKVGEGHERRANGFHTQGRGQRRDQVDWQPR